MAEIKISELSIGDWVRYDRGTDVVQIMGIYVRNNQECVVMSDSYFPNGVIGFVECIKPIPLTPEILEKNGLCVVEEDADFSEYELFGSENFSIFHTKGTLHYRLETPQASVVCWNVHQLQHALRLAGVEKEIEV
jgi:hypothetical protein